MRPEEIRTRTEFARELTFLRRSAGLTIRATAELIDATSSTIGGWFNGTHVPVGHNEPKLRSMLALFGVHRDEHDAWVDAAARVRRGGVRGVDPAVAPPYRGFDVFGVDDYGLFFGRGDTTDLVISTVLEQAERATAVAPGSTMPVVTLVGPSGAGKSSVLYAGLLAQIGREGPFESWRYTYMSPGRDPLAAAENALLRVPPGDGPVLFAIDQVEEAWTLGSSYDSRAAAFYRMLDYSTTVSPMVVVTTLRADYLGALAANPNFARPLQEATIVVPAMQEDQLREVIVSPARAVGAEVSGALLDLLLAELRPGAAPTTMAGALPLLSHALLATWLVSDKRTLTVADYMATGGIRGAVEQTAEQMYARFDYAEKTVARRQMLAMVHVDEERTSRRRAMVDELGFPPVELLPETRRDKKQQRAARVLDQFAAARLITVSQAHAEITHEALLWAWPRFQRWIAEDREGMTVHRRLQAAMTLWSEAEQAPEVLPVAARLDVFVEFAENPVNAAAMTTAEQDFVDLAVQNRDRMATRRRRRFRQLSGVAVTATVFGVVALIAAVVAVVARSDALNERDRADHSRLEAQSARLAMLAESERGVDPALSMQLAMVAYRTAPTIEARSALVDSAAQPLPVRTLTVAGSITAAPSPDGSLLAVGNADGRLRLFTVRNGVLHGPAGTAPVAGGELFATAFGPDSRTVFVGGANGMATWDVGDRASPRRLTAGPSLPGVVRDIAVDSTGTTVAVGLDGDGVRLLRRGPSGAWRELATPPSFRGAGSAVAFSPDGRLLATATADQRVDISDVGTDAVRPVSTIPLPGAANARALDATFAPDGELALGLTTRDVKVYAMGDPTRPVLTHDLADFTSYVNAVSFSPDGGTVVGASSDNTTRVYDLTAAMSPTVLPRNVLHGAVANAAFVDQGRVITASEDGAVSVWAQPRTSVRAGRSAVYQMAVSKTGAALTSNADPQGAVAQWTVGPGAAVAPRGPILPAPAGDGVTSLDLTSDGRLGVLGTLHGRLLTADVSDPARPRMLGPGVDGVAGLAETVAVSGVTSVAAIGSLAADDLAVVDVSDHSAPRVAARVRIGEGVAWASMSPDGRRVVVSTPSGRVLAVDVSRPAGPTILFDRKVFTSGALGVRFAPDGRRLVVTSEAGEVIVVDVADPRSPRILTRLSGPTSSVDGATFSRDGRRVIAGGDDGRLWVWDVADATRPSAQVRLTSYAGQIYDVAPGTDDATVLATGASGMVSSWDTRAERIAQSVCASGTAPITRAEWGRLVPDASYDPPCR